jgi:hypothetical protein
VIEESVAAAAAAATAAGSAPTTPSRNAVGSRAPASPDLDAAALARELADVKKRFLAVAKRKQAEHARRVRIFSALHLACRLTLSLKRVRSSLS